MESKKIWVTTAYKRGDAIDVGAIEKVTEGVNLEGIIRPDTVEFRVWTTKKDAEASQQRMLHKYGWKD